MPWQFFWQRRPLTFRGWLRKKRRLSDWVERALPPDVTSSSEIMKVAGHEHPSDYRAWVQHELSLAAREYRRRNENV
jgi:hypothetical protein